jgi:cysteine synthase A
VVCELSGAPTIPQVFIGGRHLGGCTETFDAFKEGSLQDQLRLAGVSFDDTLQFDPYSLLPSWLHSRKRA